jgi:hypothetical protein
MRRAVVGGLVAVVLVAACRAGVPSSTLTPTARAAVTAPASQATLLATATATATPIPTPTPLPTPTPTPTARPFATGTEGALAFVHTYEDYLIAGLYRKAWTMLGPGWQAYLGTMSTYTAERTAYMRSAGKRYTAEANPPNTKSLTDWLNGADYSSSIDMTNAVLVKVSWNALWYDNAGWEMWIVNPVPGGWELYEVR